MTVTHFHSRWRIDADYKSKLSAEDRLWLEKFEGEYYRCSFKSEPLHTPAQRKELYNNQNSAFRDIVTQTSSRIIEALTKPVKPSRHTYYLPEDYKFEILTK